MPDRSKTHSPNAKFLYSPYLVVGSRLVFIFKNVTFYINYFINRRLTHGKKVCVKSYEINNQPIRKASDCTIKMFNQSETLLSDRTSEYREGSAPLCQKKKQTNKRTNKKQNKQIGRRGAKVCVL